MPLGVFGDEYSWIPLLICCRQLFIRHVLVALHAVVFDVHRSTFIYIEIHSPHVYHSTSLLISSCSSLMSSGFLALCQSLVSSANLDTFLAMFVSRSLMYIKNNSRSNILPSGTPGVTSAQLLYDWLMHARWRCPDNQFRIHLAASPWMPCALTFVICV